MKKTKETKKFAIYEFPFGFLKIEYSGERVTYLNKISKFDSRGEKNAFTDYVHKEIMEYFSKKRREFSFEFTPEGTEFEKKVWKELMNIPYGETRTYKEIAINIGNPKAYRAVGSANNKNPIFIVVPCHRVIGSDGKLTGYAGGIDMKEFLLNLEKENKSE